MREAEFWVVAQPRLDTLVTDPQTREPRWRTDYSGTIWLGRRPDPSVGLPRASAAAAAELNVQFFLPDTSWYRLAFIDDAAWQVSIAVQSSHGKPTFVAEPVVELFEHPDEGGDGVGLCLTLHGEGHTISAYGYRVTMLTTPEAVPPLE